MSNIVEGLTCGDGVLTYTLPPLLEPLLDVVGSAACSESFALAAADWSGREAHR